MFSLTKDDESIYFERSKSFSDEFYFLNKFSDFEAAQFINSKNIQILFNLNGYTASSMNEIFVHRPSPIQIQHMGYPGSMGADFIDYFIGDKITIDEKSRKYYSESIIYMPHCYQANSYSEFNKDF